MDLLFIFFYYLSNFFSKPMFFYEVGSLFGSPYKNGIVLESRHVFIDAAPDGFAKK